MESNKLLIWAKEHILEWPEDYTHLRCDRSGIFFSGGQGSWHNEGTRWSQVGSHWSWNKEGWDLGLGTQVITMQEWSEAKGIKNNSEDKTMIKFILEEDQNPNKVYTLADVETNQFFIDEDGAFCQKVGREQFIQISDSDGQPNSIFMDNANQYRKIYKVLPRVAKLEITV